MGVDGAVGAPEHEHVESKVSHRPDHAAPGAAVKQEPVGVLHGDRQRRDRAGDLGVLGLQPLGIDAGAAGDQHRGGEPGCRHHRRQQRQQQIVLAGEDARRQPHAKDDQRQRIDGGIEKAEGELAPANELRRHSEPVQDQGAQSHPPPRAGGDLVYHGLALAQGTGTQMARSVADLVLVRDDFGVIPRLIDEGRQILRNVQRVAKLFLTKTAFTAVVSLAVGITTATYPLLPRQFTLGATVTIGIPAFVLALAPSTGQWRPEHFLSSVTRFAIIAGVPIGIGITAGYLLARYGLHLGLARSRTVATATVVLCGLALVLQIENECGGRRRRIAVAALCALLLLLLLLLLFVLSLFVPFLRHFCELAKPTAKMIAAWVLGTTLGAGGMILALRLFAPGRTAQADHTPPGDESGSPAQTATDWSDAARGCQAPSASALLAGSRTR